MNYKNYERDDQKVAAGIFQWTLVILSTEHENR